MARLTDAQVAEKHHIADVNDRFGPFCTSAYALSNKFQCHSCRPEAEAAHNAITGYGVPRYRLQGLDSQQQAYDVSGGYMFDVLVAFAREMSKRFAQRMQDRSDHLNALLDKRQAA